MAYFRAGNARATHEAQQITVAKTTLATFQSNVSGLYIPEILAYIQATQSGSGDPSPSNPRAITGWSAVNTTRTGKNLFDLNCLTATGITIADGVASGTASAFNTAFGINAGGVPCKVPTEQFTLSVKGYTTASGSTSGSGLLIRVYYTDETYSQLAFENNTTSATIKTLTTTAGKTPAYIIISYGIMGSNTWYISEIQLELGSTDTAYHAYTGTTATTALGGTYYGGYLNVTTGVLTLDKLIKDLGTLDYTYVASGNRFTNSGSGIAGEVKAPASDSQLANIMCDKLKPMSLTALRSSSDDYLIAIGDTGRISIRWTAATQDPTVFKTAITGTNLVYELATPQTIQLTPAQIEQLLGQNNVFASTGDVAIKFWRID